MSLPEEEQRPADRQESQDPVAPWHTGRGHVYHENKTDGQSRAHFGDAINSYRDGIHHTYNYNCKHAITVFVHGLKQHLTTSSFLLDRASHLLISELAKKEDVKGHKTCSPEVPEDTDEKRS